MLFNLNQQEAEPMEACGQEVPAAYWCWQRITFAAAMFAVVVMLSLHKLLS